MKKKTNKAFIEKIKSLSIKTSKVQSFEDACPDCGLPMKLIGAASIAFNPKPNDDEQSFSA